MSTIVLVVEGVLAGKSDDIDLSQTQADPAVLQLYAGLARAGRLLLASTQERRLLDHWCRLNGLTAHQGVTALDERTIIRLRAAGEDVALYVDHDGQRAAIALRNGVHAMLYTKPSFARASHNPTVAQLRRPFSEVLAEAQGQREARAQPVVGVDD